MNKIYRLICVVMLSSIECCPRAVHSDDGHKHGTERKDEHERKHAHDESRETNKRNHSDDGHDHEKPAHGDKEEHAEHGEHKNDHGKDEPEEHEEGEHEEEEEVSSSVGADKAVTEADPSKGFKLSERALKTLEIQARPIGNQGSMTIPNTCLVEFKDEAGIYRWRDGYFKLIEGTARKQGRTVLFKPRSASDLRAGDQVVTNGVALLRVAELDAFSEGEAGHAH